MSYSSEITKLLEQGAKAYAAKNYEESSDFYGNACRLYSESNEGTEDPELLLLYGKALFQVAVSKNGLFGGEPAKETNKEDQAEEEETEQDKAAEKGNGLYQFSEDVPLAEEEDDDEENDTNEQTNQEQEEEDAEKDDQDDGDGEGKAEQQEQEEEEEQSDFEVAWDILDLSRSLFQAKLDAFDDKTTIPLDDPTSSTDPLYQLKLKLSNLHDLLGEISLETENFKQSTEDFLKTLEFRSEVYKFKSNLISEIHYKLSLSLEFTHELEGSKEKAIFHLEKAIESMKQRETKDEELIKELEMRLVDLKKDPNELLDLQKKEILKGILGESSSTGSGSEKKVTEQKVNDLTSIVKKRKNKKPADTDNNKKPKV